MKSNVDLRLAKMTVAGTAALVASTASADLASFVTSSEQATHNQQQAGLSMQRTCTALAPAQQTLTGASRDLFLRCNELVQTATSLEQGRVLPRSLGYSTDEELLAAVQQVNGEEIAAQGTLSTQVSSAQFSNIAGRLNALRLGTASAMARGKVAALTPKQTPTNSIMLAAASPEVMTATDATSGSDVPVSRWGGFVEGGYSFGDHDQTAREDEFEFDSYSVTAGADYNFGDAVVGASIGFDRYTADFDTAQLVSGGDVEVKGLSGSVFAAWFGGNWNLNGIVSYGDLESDVSRRVIYDTTSNSVCTDCGARRTLTGDPDGKYVAAGLTAGYDFDLGAWQLAPSASLSYRKVDMDGYDESDSAGGGLALRYDDQEIESLRSIVSVQLSIPLSRSFGVLTPSFRAEWHHEFEDDERTLRAKYLLEDTFQSSAPNDFGCSVSCFNFVTDRPDTDFGVVGAGLSALFAQRVQAFITYETLVGSADLTIHSIAVGVRSQF